MTESEWDETFSERAAIFEFDADMPRDIAEAWARAEVTELHGQKPVEVPRGV